MNRYSAIKRWPWVQQMTGISRATVWRLEKKGDFPARRQLGPNSVGWLEHEVIAWIEKRATYTRQETD